MIYIYIYKMRNKNHMQKSIPRIRDEGEKKKLYKNSWHGTDTFFNRSSTGKKKKCFIHKGQK